MGNNTTAETDTVEIKHITGQDYGKLMVLNMPYFLKCDVDEYTHHDCTYHNNPVNLNLCRSIRKLKISGESYIQFDGNDVTWRFKTEDERDYEYNRVLSKLE